MTDGRDRQRGEMERATKILDTGRQRMPESAEIWLALGTALGEQGDDRELDRLAIAEEEVEVPGREDPAAVVASPGVPREGAGDPLLGQGRIVVLT